MRRVALCLLPMTLLLVTAAAAFAGDSLQLVGADTVLLPRAISARIVNGLDTWAYPSVGALLNGNGTQFSTAWCSGTLIGCQTFLTAGHCVADDLTPSHYQVFLPNAGFFSVASIDLHPSFNFPVGDVAVLTLSTAETGISPTPINTVEAPPSGTAGTIVGFGRSGGNNYDYGLKRLGDVTSATCTSGISNTTSVCWLFQNPLGPAGTDSSTCNGDSGGPLFMDFGSGDMVAGVTSGGANANCLPNDLSFDANVFHYASFIQSAAGADLGNTTCGTIPQVGGPATMVIPFSGTVGSGSPQSVISFDVPSGTTQLRVAMNAIDDGSSDFDLYVKAGSAPTTADYDCKQDSPTQYGYCQFEAPATGTWYALINRFAGSGEYQVTVTEFGAECSSPGSDGQPCDDGNVCTQSDSCQSGACTGAPVTDGTTCDDGNTCTDGDSCQAGICTGAAVTDGTACDDGDPCTQPDLCQGGSCSGPAPALSCKQPFVSGKSVLFLKNRDPSSGNRLTWKWARGSATAKAELGDPTATTSYGVCVYDEAGDVPQQIVKQVMPAGSDWRQTNKGFVYRDRKLLNGAVNTVVLKEGADKQAKIIVRGKGDALGLSLLTAPLQQQSQVIVQVLNGTSCWEADYGTNIQNAGGLFKARSD